MSRPEDTRHDVGAVSLRFSKMAALRTRTLVGSAGEPTPVKKLTGPSIGLPAGRGVIALRRMTSGQW